MIDDEFWDWAPNAPVKIDCSDCDSKSLPYWPYGCVGCSYMDHMDQWSGCRCGKGNVFNSSYSCDKNHSIVQFEVHREFSIGRKCYFVMYRTYEPNQRPTPIPATTIAGRVDEIAAEAKPILPEKEKAYGNLFPGGSAEVARRIIEKAQRLTGKATSDETIDDTERDLYNYIAIHRYCRVREGKKQ